MRVTDLLIAAAFAALTGTASAAFTDFSDGFEGVTPPAAPSSTRWGRTTGVITDADVTSFGIQTNYAIVAGGSKELFSVNLTEVPTLSAFSFDFVDLTPIGTAGTADDGINIGWGQLNGDLNTTGGVVTFKLNQGKIINGQTATISSQVAYTQNTPHSITLVYNSGTDLISDYSGTRDLAGDSADLYLDGSYAATLTVGSAHLAKVPRRIGFRTFSGDPNANIRIDNVLVTAVPEPGTIALAATVAGIALTMRRRRSA